MKKTLAILAATCLLIDLTPAQTTATIGTGGPSSIVGYQIGEQGADSRVWQKIVRTEDAQGHSILQTNQAYVELTSGLNHLVNGQWVESKEEIDLLPNSTAAATQGQHQVYFPGDIRQGQIRLVTADGKVLQSRPMGLSYFDGSNSVLIAELKDSTGWLVGPNQVIYPDAFTDFKADLQYTYTKAGFEQDIILREQPPLPSTFNLQPETCRLQVLTEFFNPPQPSVTATTVPTTAGNLEDDLLSFGAMQMGRGKAFLLGTNSPEVEVNKQWLQLEGRQFLVEEVSVASLADELNTLPQATSQANAGTTKHIVSKNLILPPQRLAGTGTKSLMLAKESLPSQGLVLDYQILNGSLTNYTFRGDTTYYITGPVNLYYGINTFEGGTVIKYTNSSSASIQFLSGNVMKCQGAAYRPIVLTSMNDNSVGEAISGSTGNPSVSSYTALNFQTSTFQTLSHLRVAYASVALLFPYGPSGAIPILSVTDTITPGDCKP
jgi:hypothetical protein